jgi:hypothetical protein
MQHLKILTSTSQITGCNIQNLPIHIVEAFTKNNCFPVTKSLPEFLLTCHKGSATKAHAKSSGHLNAAFITELPTKEGSPYPTHKAIIVALHQAGGSKTCWRVTKILRDRHTKVQVWSSLKNQYKITTPCSHSHSRASLALHLTKLVLNLRIWSMSSLVGLENFSRVFVTLTSQELQRPQRPGVRPYIYYTRDSLRVVTCFWPKKLKSVG